MEIIHSIRPLLAILVSLAAAVLILFFGKYILCDRYKSRPSDTASHFKRNRLKPILRDYLLKLAAIELNEDSALCWDCMEPRACSIA